MKVLSAVAYLTLLLLLQLERLLEDCAATLILTDLARTLCDEVFFGGRGGFAPLLAQGGRLRSSNRDQLQFERVCLATGLKCRSQAILRTHRRLKLWLNRGVDTTWATNASFSWASIRERILPSYGICWSLTIREASISAGIVTRFWSFTDSFCCFIATIRLNLIVLEEQVRAF